MSLAAYDRYMSAVRAALQSRYTLWLLLAAPLLWTIGRYVTGGLYYGEVIHLSGEFSIRLMMLAMAATPLALALPGQRFTRWLLKNRRYLGVASFAYAVLHTAVYLDKTALVADILADALLAEYWTGWVAMLLFAVLAATSNDASVRWLRRAWKRLHRAVYLAAVASFIHWVLVAFDPAAAYVHIGILAGLEAFRVWKLNRIRGVGARR